MTIIEFIFITIGAIIINAIVHESGHLISALLCKVRVNILSIGFGKPYLKKVIKKIEFRISPWLLGGYVSLHGETKKVKKGFLAQKYKNKVLILMSGVLLQFIFVCICHLINYRSILMGLYIDFHLLLNYFNEDPLFMGTLLFNIKPNYFLLTCSFIGFTSILFNLLPIPLLDGGALWTVWLETWFPKRHKTIERICFWFGITILTTIQLFVIVYLFT